ncbi:DUF2442 domain-containing protein [Clostridium ljungdahlii]|uniref:DUF2442 domain-containing protein n=1 Tax=Clostridium ljungdahlii TaxID=1538 RepID=A0A162L2V5_9CLOT|nr:DUF2442 domain-containing protein [Clostridium ljungdahlii]OAA87786.1 hypothetical protein WY13_01901 [Clostridium ljungdahlii]
MRIINISVYSSNKLLIELSNGEHRIFDISKYFDGEVFKALKDVNELKRFKVEFECIEWICGASLSKDTLLIKSIIKEK